MEMTIREAASVAGVDPRTVQRAIESGRLGMARLIGRQTTTDDLAVQAWLRTISNGRKWSPRIRGAALDLLSGDTCQTISSSERSRLKSSLRSMTARQIASASWCGTWARYRTFGDVDAQSIGPSLPDLFDLDLVAGQSWVRFVEVQDLENLEAKQPVKCDPDGDLVVIERSSDGRRAQQLVDIFVLGDVRASLAAGDLLEATARAI